MSGKEAASVEESMIPRLDAKEVAAVFSAPFHNFLKKEDEVRQGDVVPGAKKDWYTGVWTDWHDSRWRMHNFYVPVNNQKVAKPKVREGGQTAIAEELESQEDESMRYKVWGMTARILVDAARVAYGEDPEFEVCLSSSYMYLLTQPTAASWFPYYESINLRGQKYRRGCVKLTPSSTTPISETNP